jgi:mercuric ion binding protein
MRSLLAFSLFAIALLHAPLLSAQSADESPNVTVGVDGLTCPFCAYGIEKKMLEIDGVASVAVQLDAGAVELWFNEGATISEERIREAVGEAGFEVRGILWTTPQ